MEAKIYFAVKVICALFVFYHLWIFLFCRKIYGLWNKLHNWARIARVGLWKYRKKRMAEKAKRARRKKIYDKDLHTDKTKPIQAEIPQKVEESPPVYDEPNEVMGKSNIIYYEDTTAARTIPTHSLELKQVELPVDKDVNPDDVEDNFEPQKGLTEEDMKKLMEPEGILPDPDFDISMTYEEMNNMVDVLNSDTHSEENGLRAAQMIFQKLPGTEFLRLIENELADQQKIDRLLHDYLDKFGIPLPESKRRERKIEDFNIKKYV